MTASHGLRVTVDGGLSGDADLVIVPGGGWNDRAAAGARAEADRGVLPARLAELHERGARIGSVCTGGMLLAAAGLTDGRATTHHGALDDLRASRAEVVDAWSTTAMSSAGGVTSGLDLALHLVERQVGKQLADGIARRWSSRATGACGRATPARDHHDAAADRALVVGGVGDRGHGGGGGARLRRAPQQRVRQGGERSSSGCLTPMRAIWTGAISFGLVNVPIRLYSAVQRKTVRFNQLDSEGNVRIGKAREPVTGDEVRTSGS